MRKSYLQPVRFLSISSNSNLFDDVFTIGEGLLQKMQQSFVGLTFVISLFSQKQHDLITAGYERSHLLWT